MWLGRSDGTGPSPCRYKLTVGRRDATKLVTGVQHQLELVRAALQAALPDLAAEVPVTGVLAFFEASRPLFPPDEIDGVRLEGPKSTARLTHRSGQLAPPVVAQVAAALRGAFPPA